MAFLFKPPDGALIEGIWRCARGHESPARVKMADGVITKAYEMVIQTVDGRELAICLQCIAEDYHCELVEFGDG